MAAMLGQLEAMGFDGSIARLALDETGNRSVEAALDWITTNATAAALADSDAAAAATVRTPDRRVPTTAPAGGKKRAATRPVVPDDDDEDYFSLEVVRSKSKNGITVLDKTRLVRSVEEQIERISATLAVPHATSSALLRFYKWDEQKLTECYFEDPDRVLQKAGVAAAPTGSASVSAPATASDECGVCFETLDGPCEAMACGHRFCDDCWAAYFNIKVAEGESLGISCMAQKCPCKVPSSLVQRLAPAALWARYQEFVVKSFIEDNPNMRWCPAPACGNALQSELQAIDDVQCACGFKFCFRCNDEAHAPVPCFRLKDWVKRCKEDGETKNWIVANTKDCPKCQSAIEKNGGCNYVQCFKCKYGMCWVCMGPHDHNMAGHKCKPYEDKTEDQESARASLEKYLHYYNRYTIHEQSKKLEEKLRQTARVRMDLLRKSGTVNVDFIETAVEQLFECRRTLKYTYVYAFYGEGQEKVLFEFLQNDLEHHTELLSGVLETELNKPRTEDGHVPVVDREQIVNLNRVAARMLKNLLDAVRDGLMEGASFTPKKPDAKPATAAAKSKPKTKTGASSVTTRSRAGKT
eukprot:TRINITY_DN8991_c0_g1_i2.p1 TRINITY_DN8991_c0_g1~~TRINITY_DN8991_c0_g1_i2.p1  ORF type:complete len:624 (-),score=203.46 TRINITY_DN8991_c0_g1_i2:146-1888(-)